MMIRMNDDDAEGMIENCFLGVAQPTHTNQYMVHGLILIWLKFAYKSQGLS